MTYGIAAATQSHGPWKDSNDYGRLIRDHPTFVGATNDIRATIDNAIQSFHVTIPPVPPALGR